MQRMALGDLKWASCAKRTVCFEKDAIVGEPLRDIDLLHLRVPECTSPRFVKMHIAVEGISSRIRGKLFFDTIKKLIKVDNIGERWREGSLLEDTLEEHS